MVIEQQPTRGGSTDADSSSKSQKKKSRSKKEIMCQIYRPNTGLQVRHESLAELEKKYRKVASEEAEPHWTEQYDASVNTCSHAYWNGNCRNVSLGNDCEVGGITASMQLQLSDFLSICRLVCASVCIMCSPVRYFRCGDVWSIY